MRRLTTLVIIATLAACSAPEAPEAPVANPAPTALLRIHGSADPSLAITVTTQYLSSAGECRRSAGLPGRTSTALLVPVHTPVTRTGSDYEATIAIDHFRDDACRWYPFVIGFQVSNQDGLTTGEFATSPQGTTLIPGPENRIWISRPGEGLAGADGSRREGTTFVRPLELKCRAHQLREARGLTCVENSPRELPLLSGAAREVRVDFEDLTQR